MFASKIPQAEAVADWRQSVAPPQPTAMAPRSGALAPPLQSTIGNQATLRLLAGRRHGWLTQPGGAAEREADQMADAAVAGRPPRAAAAGGAPVARSSTAAEGARADGPAPGVVASPGRALDPDLRQWFEPRFGRDLSGLRIHDDARAAALSRSLGARAFAQGGDVYFGAGEFAPATEPGRHLIAHEIAHTLQPQDPGRIARKTLTDLSPATRQKLMFARVAPEAADIDAWIKTYFVAKPNGGFTSMINAEFGADITDPVQQKGLQSIAMELRGASQVHVTSATATEPEQRTNTDPDSWPLPPDTIIELVLDLRPQGGEHAIFRFTRYGTGSGDTVLIEKTKVLAPAPVKGAPPATAPTGAPAGGGAAAGSFIGLVHVGGVGLTIDPKFGDVRGKVIQDAIQMLPDPIRAKVDGVVIEAEGAGKGPTGETGDYLPDRDVVRLWDSTFDATDLCVGEATRAAYVIIHELGHLIDLRPEFKAQRDREEAQARRRRLEAQMRALETKYVDPNDPLPATDTDKDPRVIADKAKLKPELDKAIKDIADANTALANAKSLSGHEVDANTESLLTAFAKAIVADGVKAVKDAKSRNVAVDAANAAAAKANAADPKGPQIAMKDHEKALTGGVSGYAATDLMEAFAENFSYYVLDEAAFHSIRPKTYAFFAKAFPKTGL